MCPLECGQIQTSVHAGGMASARMRRIVSASVTFFPSALIYSNFVPFFFREMPGDSSDTQRRPAAFAASSDSGFAATVVLIHSDALRLARCAGAETPVEGLNRFVHRCGEPRRFRLGWAARSSPA